MLPSCRSHTAQVGYGRKLGDIKAQQALLARSEERQVHNPAPSPTVALALDAPQHVGLPIAQRQRAPDGVPAPKDAPVLTFAQVAEAVTVGAGALLAEARNVYCQWTGPGGGPEPAPPGTVFTPALVHHAEHLVGTLSALAASTGIAEAELTETYAAASGLISAPTDGGIAIWAPSGRLAYDPAAFYQPSAYIDAFGATWTLQRDAAAMLLTAVTDPFGHATIALPNYRILQPYAVIDANGNRNVLRFDALGVPIALSTMGKEGSDDGDIAVIDAPEADPADAYSATFAYTLGGADTGTPDWVQTRQRVWHGEPSSPWTEVFAYFDGSGRPALTMTRALPDDVSAAKQAERWVGSGKVTYDNKGNAIKQYEPFFAASGGWVSDDALKSQGVTPILRYDPLGRLIRTDFPDGTYTRAERTPWSTTLWDQNDTVADSRWYQDRIALPADNPGHIAAKQAYQHRNTPWVEDVDAFGRVVRQVLDNTLDDAANRVEFQTLIAWDLADRPTEVIDARDIPTQRWRYDLLGQVVGTSSPDSGARSFAFAADGLELARWTPTGTRVRTNYDAERRPVARVERLPDGSERTIERMVYGEELPPDAAKAANLLGTLVENYDSSGVAITTARTFQGDIAASERRLLQDPATPPDWPEAPLAATAYTTTFAYDALHRVVRTTTADGTTIHRAYDLRGNLDRVTEGETGANVLLEHIAYNARGQRVSVRRGNGTCTAHAHDPWTFRLISTWSGKLDGSGVLQDLTYTYDAVGNVVRQVDVAQPVVFYANAKVEPAQIFRYDAAYRLIEATGREQIVAGYVGAPGPDGMQATKLPASALRTYTQTYAYDAVGNLTSMVHQAGAGNVSSGWTRTWSTRPEAAGWRRRRSVV